jgi:hypothetical protein
LTLVENPIPEKVIFSPPSTLPYLGVIYVSKGVIAPLYVTYPKL